MRHQLTNSFSSSEPASPAASRVAKQWSARRVMTRGRQKQIVHALMLVICRRRLALMRRRDNVGETDISREAQYDANTMLRNVRLNSVYTTRMAKTDKRRAVAAQTARSRCKVLPIQYNTALLVPYT